MDIRKAKPDDALAISKLIKSLAHFFTLNADGSGAERFLQSLEPESILRLITAENFSYFVAYQDAELVGVVAIRDDTHLYHLFVAERVHRQGRGRRLWAHAKDVAVQAGNAGCFTVNSTVYAVQSYESLGFKVAGLKTERDGIAFVPMRLDLAET